VPLWSTHTFLRPLNSGAAPPMLRITDMVFDVVRRRYHRSTVATYCGADTSRLASNGSAGDSNASGGRSGGEAARRHSSPLFSDNNYACESRQ
jgi:hypothetical protein